MHTICRFYSKELVTIHLRMSSYTWPCPDFGVSANIVFHSMLCIFERLKICGKCQKLNKNIAIFWIDAANELPFRS